MEVRKQSFSIRVNVSDYLTMRENSVEGVLARRALSSERWNALAEHLHAAFARCYDEIEYTRDVNFAFSTKPARYDNR